MRVATLIAALLLVSGAAAAEVTFTDFPPQRPDLYWYEVEFVDLYDADTITVNIDLGFGVSLRSQTLRLYGIDAWEMRGEERERGKAAKEFALGLLSQSDAVMIRSIMHQRGKYGRWLAELFVEADGQWVNLNKRLVETGHAEIVEY